MLLVLLMVELTPLTETSIVQIVGYIVFLAHVLLFIRVKPPPHFLRDLMNILSLLEKLFEHSQSCQLGKRKENFSIHFLENIYSRGKYSLSEREYLWNERLRGVMNIQKVLKS